MKKIFLLSLLTLSLQVYAQNKHIDSLTQKLKAAGADTNRVNILNELGDAYIWTRTDTAVMYAQQALDLAQKLEFNSGEVKVLNTLVQALIFQGDLPKALATGLRAVRQAQSLGDKELTYASFYQVGECYDYAGNEQKALDYDYLILKHKNEFKGFNAYEERIDQSAGEDFLRFKKLDSAEYFIQRGFSIDIKNKVNWYPMWWTASDLAVGRKQYKKAISYIYKFSVDTVASIRVSDSNDAIADIYLKMGMTDSAIYCAKKAIGMQKQIPMLEDLREAGRILSDIYASKHQIDSAYKYQGIMMAANDNIFSNQKIRTFQDVGFSEQKRRQEMATAELKYKSRIRIYVLAGALAVFLMIGMILWRNNRQQQKTNEHLSRQKQEIENALDRLKSTQNQLIQREKMASLGELTAGIAHEIQNPLNFVNNFSDVNREMIVELKDELKSGHYDEVLAIADGIEQNEEKINHHGKRADSIVKGMLEHSRISAGEKQPTNINVLAEDFLKLAYNGLKAKNKDFDAALKTHFDKNLPTVSIVPQDMGRVLVNLYNNAFYAVQQKQKTGGADYKPEVSITTFAPPLPGEGWGVKVRDNGNGIPDGIKDKIMQPFFTTKPTGEGTGLGLSLSYDIVVKIHGGSISVNSREGEGAEFIISIPQ